MNFISYGNFVSSRKTRIMKKTSFILGRETPLLFYGVSKHQLPTFHGRKLAIPLEYMCCVLRVFTSYPFALFL